MELFRKETQIDFMGLRPYTKGVSFILCVLAIVIVMMKGLNYGLEFTGGTQVGLRFDDPVQVNFVEKQLEAMGFDSPTVKRFGTAHDILVRLGPDLDMKEAQLSEKMSMAFAEKDLKATVMSVEYVGAEVGGELAEQGGIAVLVAILATMIYIALRFEYRFAVSAAVALVHDALIVLGCFSFFQIEFDLATLAAILAVVGYSLNDTIVVFDRARENFRKLRKESVREIMNISINQTLSRTIMTSVLTLLVVVALLIYGGESLFGFSLALTIGIVAGTYSSIYVAGALAVTLGLSRNDMLVKARPTAEEVV